MREFQNNHRSRYLAKLPEAWSTANSKTSVQWLRNSPGDSFLCSVTDQSGEALGWLLVDSTVQGRSHGGVRLGLDVTVPMMERLARRMTLKFGFVGVANGGAKAGILGDPEGPPEDRLIRLKKFGEAIEPILLLGHYAPHPDLGTSTLLIEQAFGERKLPADSREPSRELSGFMTSLSVVVSAERAAKFLGKSVPGMSVAVEGFGKVGSAVADGLIERGAKIHAVSTSHGTIYNDKGLDIDRLKELHSTLGSDAVHLYKEAEQLDRSGISALPVDLFCPCARESIDAKNVKNVKARIISPGANCPVSDEAEQMLVSNGILCLPDFVSNSGGVLGGTMSFAGLTNQEIRSMMEEHLGARITALLDRSQKTGESLNALAAKEATDRFEHLKENAEKESFSNMAFGFGLKLYRQGALPKSLTRALAKHYFLSKVR